MLKIFIVKSVHNLGVTDSKIIRQVQVITKKKKRGKDSLLMYIFTELTS